MTANERMVRISLLTLLGADELLGAAYSGQLVQFVAIVGTASRWRVVTFMGEGATSRAVEVPWSDVVPVLPALRTFCERDLDVAGRFDTSDGWSEIDLAVSLDGRPSRRLHLAMRSSGFEGPDEALLTAILDMIEGRAGLRRTGA